MKTRKLSVRGGWIQDKEVKGGARHGHTQTQINTPPEAYRHTTSHHPVSLLALINFFFVFSFEKETTLVGSCYAAHQLSDDIILSEAGLYLVSDSVQWLLLHYHPCRDWQRQRLWECGGGSVLASTG